MKAITLAASLLLLSVPAMAIEEPEFKVIQKLEAVEIREYKPFLVAEIRVEAGFEDAGNLAFQPLFKYISGNNRGQQKIEMTAPVTQVAASGTKIEMTAPVTQRGDADGKAQIVGFVMPASFTPATLPEPLDPRVTTRQVPSATRAVIRYRGTWSRERHDDHEKQLRDALATMGWRAVGPAVFARYDPPIMPWFMRRNEILVDVVKVAAG